MHIYSTVTDSLETYRFCERVSSADLGVVLPCVVEKLLGNIRLWPCSTAIWRYDLEIVGLEQELLGVKGKSFPRLNEALPSLGPGKPMPGDDRILKVTPRGNNT